MNLLVRFLTVFVVLLLIACKGSRTSENCSVRDTLAILQSHNVKLDTGKMYCCVPDNDTTKRYMQNVKYQLITYVDPTKCTPCIINRMYHWNSLIEKVRECNKDVDFIFYI